MPAPPRGRAEGAARAERGRGDEAIGVLLAGAGAIAAVHAAALARIEGVVLSGIVNDEPGSALELARRTGAPRFGSLGEAARATGARVVFVCLPTPLHRAAVTQAARAGLDVFCEKPVARTPSAAEAMIAACERAGVLFMVGHVLRFFPQYARMHGLLARGELGRPATARLSRGGAAPRGARGWYARSAASGGVLVDLLVHDFDWLRWAFGPVTRVHARATWSGAPRLSSYALAVLRHASGVISHVEGYWGHDLPFRTRVEIAADRGALEYDSASPVRSRSTGRQQGERQRVRRRRSG